LASFGGILLALFLKRNRKQAINGSLCLIIKFFLLLSLYFFLGANILGQISFGQDNLMPLFGVASFSVAWDYYLFTQVSFKRLFNLWIDS